MSNDASVPTQEKHYITLITGIVIALIFLFYMFSFTVQYGEVAVLTRFGKPVKSITEPGLNFKIPLVHKVHKYDARPQVSEDRIEQTYTRDKKTIIIEAYIIWRVDDPLEFLKTMGSLEEARSNLSEIVWTKKTAVIGQHDLTELISTSVKEPVYDQIESEILNEVRKSEISNWGIDVAYVGIKRFALPEKITPKVFARMKAERKQIEDDLLSKGESEAARIMANADSDPELIIAQAEATAKRISSEGVSEAAGYYEKFKENPELAIFLKKIEVLKKTLKENTTIILDTNTQPLDLLNNKPEISQ